MTTFENLKDGPECQVKNVRGSGWVKHIKTYDPITWRIRDAWEVLQGRAIAVRQSTAEEMETRYGKK